VDVRKTVEMENLVKKLKHPVRIKVKTAPGTRLPSQRTTEKSVVRTDSQLNAKKLPPLPHKPLNRVQTEKKIQPQIDTLN
jgi:hypothetical protein